VRILIHAVSAKRRGGAESHLTGFIPALEAQDRENEYLLCVNDAMGVPTHGPRIQVMSVPMQSPVQRLAWDLVTLPRLARRHRADLLIALLSFGSPRPPCPQIVLARNPLFCSHYGDGLGPADRVGIALRRRAMRWTMRASRLVVCPTRAMRDMILNHCQELSEDRFRVLPHALEPIDRQGPRDLPPAVEAALPERRADDTLRLLYVGHLLPYKRLDVVVSALERVAQTGRRLHLYLTIAKEDWPAGYDRWMASVERAGLRERVTVLGKVSPTVARRLYPRCDVLLFPSLCESFGFPIVEAMGWGLPIVAAGTPLNREMADAAAVYYPPLSAEGCAESILAVAASRETRERLGRNGLQRSAAHLDWFQYAGGLLALYKDALAS
jgi:glycosyltransferase involved in cell wall biosynthesis